MKQPDDKHTPRGAIISDHEDEKHDPDWVPEDQKSEADLAAHQAELARAAETEKAKIDEHAFADRSEIDDQAAADRAAVDAKLEAAKPEAERVSPEDEHLRRLQVLRHVRDEAHVAERQHDNPRGWRAVRQFADLVHEMMAVPISRPVEVVKDPLAHEFIGHPKAPAKK